MSDPIRALCHTTTAWIAVALHALGRTERASLLPSAQALRAAWDKQSPEAVAQLRELVAQERVAGSRGQFNLLDGLVMASINRTDRAAWLALIGWAVDLGFSPNRFNGLVTPVGMAGYYYQVDLLECFRQKGADLNLELSAEHAAGSGLAGTTLLYRIALRPQGNPREAVETVDYLIHHVPGSLKADAQGNHPATDEHVPLFMRTAIRAIQEQVNRPH